MANYVLVHGGWHTGELLEATAAPLRADGHIVHLPTLAGNRPGDTKDIGLKEAIDSLLQYLADHDLRDVIMMGHSYGGMIITGAADRAMARVRRLIYWNAFVPNDGENLLDLVPPHYVEMFKSLVQPDGSVSLPFNVWREAFINDASLELAQSAYAKLNPHPWKTFTEPVRLSRNPAAFPCGKSYLNCVDDTAMPHSHPWHPRLSERLGLFRLVQIPGSHELCFTAPERLAQGVMDAGRD